MWTFLFSAFLICLSVGMMWSHAQAWRARQAEGLNERDFAFFRRQYQQRLRTSGVIGVVGAVVAASPFLSGPTTSAFYWYWATLMTLVIVLGVMALADMRSTHQHTKDVLRDIVPRHFPLPKPKNVKSTDRSIEDN